jgi:hypothetical protein
MNERKAAVAMALLSSLLAGRAHAVDRPIDAVRLLLKKTPTKETVLFVSRDPNFLFPPVGSADDPATGTPGGVVVELFSVNEGAASLGVPAGAGWTVKEGNTDAFKFVNRQAPSGGSPVRLAILKEGRLLRVVAGATGLPLAGPQGAVGIRVVTGTRRSCALFDAATIRKDEAGRFLAKGAVASSLTDCADVSLGGTTTTTTSTTATTSTSTTQPQPCGVIPDPYEPTCGGTCPPGETCTGELSGQLVPECKCNPVGVTACIGSGYPLCGGVCSEGRQCQAFHILPGATPEFSGCACVDTSSSCDHPAGSCFGVGVCPPGEVCNGMGPPTSACQCGSP